VKIAVLTIGTGKYVHLAKELHKSIRKNFMTNHKVDIILFTDSEEKFASDVKLFHTPRLGFPGDTLYRYHYFLKAEQHLKEYDFLFYLDADLLVEFPVGDEIIGDIVAVEHPGFYGKNDGTFERRVESTAFVEERITFPYFCGGVQGGRTKHYLEACHSIVKNINIDDSNGIVAIWHDESHWNCYLANNEPTLILDPRYCYPTDIYFPWLQNLAKDRKIITVEKDEEEIRSQ
jgi:histo-blood group ABO system transferase